MRISLIFSVLVLTALLFYSAIQSLPATIDSAPSANGVGEVEDAAAQIAMNRAAFDEQAAVLNKTIDDLKDESQDQAAVLETTLAERSALQSQLDETLQRVSVIEEEFVSLSTAKVELTQELATLTADIESREGAFRDAEANTQATNDLIEEGRVKVETMQARITELEQVRAELSQQLAEREADSAEPQLATSNELAAAETLLEQREVDLAKAEERIAILTEMATIQVQVTADLTDEIEGFEAQVTALAAEASSLSDEVEKRDTVIAGLLTRTAAPMPSLVASCQERTDAVLAVTQISFEGSTTTIAASSIPLLEELATIASDCVQEDLTLEIEGHTSDAGGSASNLLLSDGRAKEIRDFMIESGVPALAVRAAGFGGSDPIADNATSEGQSRNQRVVFDWEQS